MKKIDCLTLGEMCSFLLDGEPVFVLRAQDLAAVPTLQEYLDVTHAANGRNVSRTKGAIERFRAWQAGHKEKVRPAD